MVRTSDVLSSCNHSGNCIWAIDYLQGKGEPIFATQDNLDYNFLEVTKENPRYGDTALKLTLGTGCIGSKADCKRANAESKKRVEVSGRKIGKKKDDNVWMSMSLLIPKDFKWGGRLTIQQWHNDIEVYEPMLETDLKNFVGLTMKNGSKKLLD